MKYEIEQQRLQTDFEKRWNGIRWFIGTIRSFADSSKSGQSIAYVNWKMKDEPLRDIKGIIIM